MIAGGSALSGARPFWCDCGLVARLAKGNGVLIGILPPVGCGIAASMRICERQKNSMLLCEGGLCEASHTLGEVLRLGSCEGLR
jgi:hypothetical protein